MSAPLNDHVVIFDLDGTLVDTAEDLVAATNAALAAEGLDPAPFERIRPLIGHGAKAMIRGGFAANSRDAPDDLSPHVTRFLDYYLANIAVFSRPYPGMAAALAELKAAGAAAAVCTNKKEAWARALLEALGLTTEFSAIVGADTAGAAKPDARPVFHAMEASARARAVFVGDSDYDIAAAEAAGLPVILADFGYGPVDLAARASARFGDFAALPALVQRAAASRW